MNGVISSLMLADTECLGSLQKEPISCGSLLVRKRLDEFERFVAGKRSDRIFPSDNKGPLKWKGERFVIGKRSDGVFRSRDKRSGGIWTLRRRKNLSVEFSLSWQRMVERVEKSVRYEKRAPGLITVATNEIGYEWCNKCASGLITVANEWLGLIFSYHLFNYCQGSTLLYRFFVDFSFYLNT